MSDKILIFDTTLRDGEQSAGVSFSATEKLEIASLLAELRVDVIEAGFPAASRQEHAAVAGVAQQVRDASICALARAVPSDVSAAVSALEGAAHPRIHVFINASDVHLAHQLRSDRAQVIARAAAMVARARQGAAEVEFSPMDATRADPEFLAELVRAALAAGASTINIPDTVGFILPGDLEGLLTDLRERVPELGDATLSFHGQDDLGMATANAISAVRAGARQLEVCVNGIGERAGNTPLEEVVMALSVHGPALGVHTDVRTQQIVPVSRMVERHSGLSVPANKAVVGRNAFRHASGVHQDGVLKHRATYEVLDPSLVGNTEGSRIVLGKLSGRAGFFARAQALGFKFSDEGAVRAFALFQREAEHKPEVHDEDVVRICQQVHC